MTNSDKRNATSGATDLLSYLRLWLRDYAGPPELVLSLDQGSVESECAVAWLTAEGPAGFGHLTLWDSGELAIEVYDGATAAVLLRHRGRVRTVADLASHLQEYVGRCALGTPRDPGDEKRDRSSLSSWSSDSAPPNRRLHL